MFERIFSYRRLTIVGLAVLLLISSQAISAQEPTTTGTPPVTPVKPEPDPKTQNNNTPPPKPAFDPKNLTVENIVEAAILTSGGREVFNQIRRNGLERGKRSIAQNDGRMIEGIYERRFKRGETSEKDLVRLDQQTPVQYGLIYANNESWGVLNSSTMFSPRAEIIRDFQEGMWHGLDALFRYKEDGSSIRLAGREKHGGVDVYVIELTHTAKTRADANAAPVDVKLVTRYYISSKLFRVLWLEYENTQGFKYTRRFYDYKVVQGTLVPYRSVLKRDDTVVEETNVLTVTYGVKLDDSQFAKTDH